MKSLRDFFSRLFGGQKKPINWDTANYGNKPSTAGDDFRKNNEA